MNPWRAIADRVWARTRPPLARLYYANGGVGDELILTAIAAAARRAGRPIAIAATYPSIWQGNSDPDAIVTDLERWHYARRRGWIATEIVHLSYQTTKPTHIAQQMAEHLELTLPSNWRPVFRAVEPTARDRRLLVVQNSCRGARYAATTKEWPQARWVELTSRLARDFRVIQVGTSQDPILPGAEDQRGRTTLHEAAALLAQATAFVGLESGLQHLAAAAGTPAVIIYGGRSRPEQTGYGFNTNLVRTPPCAGCGLNDGCPHDMICMEIPVEEVERAVRNCATTPSPAAP